MGEGSRSGAGCRAGGGRAGSAAGAAVSEDWTVWSEVVDVGRGADAADVAWAGLSAAEGVALVAAEDTALCACGTYCDVLALCASGGGLS